VARIAGSPVADGDDFRRRSSREATSVYDSYVAALETGTFEGAAGFTAAPNLLGTHPFRAASEKPTKWWASCWLLRRRGLGPPSTVRQVPDRL